MPFVTGDPVPGRQFDSITLDDADGQPVDLHHTVKRSVHRAVGLIGVQPPRLVTRVRPSVHGAIDNTRNTDGRLIVLDGRVYSEYSTADANAELRLILGAALETLDEGAALLKWSEEGGLALQALVKLHAEIEPAVEVGPNLLAYQAQFFAEDPRAYSQVESASTGGTLSTAPGGWTFPRTMPITFSASAGGTVAVANAGNRPTPARFRVYGACTNPRILLVGTSKQIAITGTIPTGSYLEIDTARPAREAITLNGTVPALSFLDSANTTWFELPNGTSTIQLLAGSFDTVARCDVICRSAYT